MVFTTTSSTVQKNILTYDLQLTFSNVSKLYNTRFSLPYTSRLLISWYRALLHISLHDPRLFNIGYFPSILYTALNFLRLVLNSNNFSHKAFTSIFLTNQKTSNTMLSPLYFPLPLLQSGGFSLYVRRPLNFLTYGFHHHIFHRSENTLTYDLQFSSHTFHVI